MLRYENGIVVAEAPKARRPIGLKSFFILAFVLSWTGAGAALAKAYAAAGAAWAQADWVAALAPLELLMLFGPLLTALIALFWNYGPGGAWRFVKRAFRLNIPIFWWVLALLGPVLLAALAWPLSAASGSDAEGPGLSALLSSAGPLFVFYLLVNTEEIAWRGYALPQLQARMSPFSANAVIIVIWAIFHLPLFAWPGGHPAGYSVLVLIGLVIPISFMLGAVFNRTGGSVLIAHLLHQGLNAWGEAFRLFPVFTGENRQMLIFVGLLCIPGLVGMVWLAAKRRPAAVEGASG